MRPTVCRLSAKCCRVLEEVVIEGVQTNTDLLYYIMHDEDYVKGLFDTSFIEKKLDKLVN